MDEFDVRRDRGGPVHAFQVELYELLERFEEDIAEEPATVAALLVEYVDSLRLLYDLNIDGGHLSEDSEVMGVMFETPDGEEKVGWLNAPRTGDYHDIDPEAFEAESDIPVQIHGTPGEDDAVTFEFGERP